MMLHINVNFLGLVVSDKKILYMFSYIKVMEVKNRESIQTSAIPDPERHTGK